MINPDGETPAYYEGLIERIQISVELNVLAEQALAGHLTLTGLEDARRRLRTECPTMPSDDVAESRLITLDFVCRKLAAVQGVPLSNYLDDVLPAAPDDLSGLVRGDDDTDRSS
jgi:hypothetical protein